MKYNISRISSGIYFMIIGIYLGAKDLIIFAKTGEGSNWFWASVVMLVIASLFIDNCVKKD